MFCKIANRFRLLGILFLVLAVFPGNRVIGAPAGLGGVTQVKSGSNSVEIHVGTGTLTIQACTPQIVRVDYRLGGKTDPDTPVIDPDNVWNEDPQATVTQDDNGIVVKTSRLSLRIDKTPCRLSLYDAAGNQLLWEQAAGGVFVAPTDEGKGGLRFYHRAGQNFYGIKAYDKDTGGQGLLRNGDNTPNRTYRVDAATQGAAAAPFVWTTAGYGMLVNSNDGYMVVDDSRLEFYYGSPPQGTSGRRYEKPNSIQFYLFVGEPRTLLAAASRITGRAPMFPRWAMGFTNSQWGIDEQELTAIVDGYRAKDIPLDNFTLDFDWKAWGDVPGGDDFGEFRWNTQASRFPSARVVAPATISALKSRMDAQGVKLTGIMKPRILRNTQKGLVAINTAQGKQADAQGYWYPGLEDHRDYFSGLPVGELNFFKFECRKWYWDQVASHGALGGGIAGFWNDEADEADVADLPGGSHQHAVFNSFEHFHMQQALYEGWRGHGRDAPQTSRMWSINRTFYLGAATGLRHVVRRHRYRLQHDGAASREDAFRGRLGPSKMGHGHGRLFRQPEPRELRSLDAVQRLRSGLSGTWHAEQEAVSVGIRLYRRGSREERHSAAVSPCPLCVRLRADGPRDRSRLGAPLMVEFPADTKSANQLAEWMFGQWLLVAPVLGQQVTQKAGQTTLRHVYLPPGTWIDFFRGTVLHGGDIDYPLNPGSWTDIPLFVRAARSLPART